MQNSYFEKTYHNAPNFMLYEDVQTKTEEMYTAVSKFLKAAMDRSGAAIALLLLSPLFAFLYWQVGKDGGPVFFGHTRIGKNGKLFKCWKFRSMVTNSQEVLKELLENDPEARAEYERDFKLRNDPRVTPIGRFLRKSSLDEIPQLFNVLRGEMSLVGPRPIVEAEKRYYAEGFVYYTAVKPGITGLWQVSGRNDTGYDLRVKLDKQYVRDWSVWKDIGILFRTVHVVLAKKGAY
jgi:undecaprenyl-phosphate galactose phosphotransferase